MVIGNQEDQGSSRKSRPTSYSQEKISCSRKMQKAFPHELILRKFPQLFQMYLDYLNYLSNKKQVICRLQAVILLLNESHELFEELLGVSLISWHRLMKLHPNSSFNLNWRKQVLPL